MRINPISMTYSCRGYKPQNQNIKQRQNQNISFGKFEDEKAEKLTYEVLEVDRIGVSCPREAFTYFKNTEFATIKTAKDKQGKDFPYIVLNKDVTDKHKNKHRFDELLKDYEFYKDTQIGETAEEAGLYDKEPYMLSLLYNTTHAYNIYEDLWEAEEDYTYIPPKTDATEDEGTGYDYWHSMDSWPFGL